MRVYRDTYGDWIAEDRCAVTNCPDWQLAMEAALGHLALHHPRPPRTGPWHLAMAWEEGRCAAARGIKNNPYRETS